MAGKHFDHTTEYTDDQRLVDANAGPDTFSDEQNQVTRSMPWMAVAVVGHAILLLGASLFVRVMVEAEAVPTINSTLDQVDQPVPPAEKQPDEPKEMRIPPIIPEDVQRPPEPDTDLRTEDPTDVPQESVSIPDSPESPSPCTGLNTAFGVGGNPGGGQPGGGLGGWRSMKGGPEGRPPIDQIPRVDAGLQWLADHQNVAGYWSAENFLNDSIRTAKGAKITYYTDFAAEMAEMRGAAKLDKGQEAYNIGLTGLALLAFVGDGHTNKDSKFSRNVTRATKYLTGVADPEGCFASRDSEEFVYAHAICTMAIAELYEMTQLVNLKSVAKKAVDFIVKCQNPGLGWRYGVQPAENDSSVTAWMVLSLKSARLAGIDFDHKTVYAGANAWYDKATKKTEAGYEETGYNRPGGMNARLPEALKYATNPSMDACNLMSRLFSGSFGTGDAKMRGLASRIGASPPRWGGKSIEDGKQGATDGPYSIDFYYWYYASLALFQMGDSYWSNWEKELIRPILLKYQRGWHENDVKAFGANITKPPFKPDGSENPDAGRWLLDEHGSWDPVDAWGSAGGRVYSTAINTLTLEVYYRYRRISAAGRY